MEYDTKDLTRERLDDGLSLNYAGQYVKCLIFCDGGAYTALDLMRQRHPNALMWQAKAAVNAGTVAEPAWGAPLAPQLAPGRDAVIRRVNARSILGQMRGSYRSVPFQTIGAVQTAGATYGWVGEAAPTPVGNMQFTSAALGVTKVSGIIAISEELAKLLTPESDRAVRNDFESGLVAFRDQQFFDPTVTATTDRPGSPLSIAPSVGSGGTSAAKPDAQLLNKTFFAQNPDARAPFWVMSPANASAYAVECAWPSLTVRGGDLFGVPAIVSASAGNRVAIIDADALLVADANDLNIDVSREASIEMNTVPTSPATASTILVNLWQIGLVGIKVTQTISWKLARPSAAVWTTATYV
jgi:hypothetical protein